MGRRKVHRTALSRRSDSSDGGLSEISPIVSVLKPELSDVSSSRHSKLTDPVAGRDGRTRVADGQSNNPPATGSAEFTIHAWSFCGRTRPAFFWPWSHNYALRPRQSTSKRQVSLRIFNALPVALPRSGLSVWGMIRGAFRRGRPATGVLTRFRWRSGGER